MYQFLTLTDALISDYSSVAVDYMLLDKPIAYLLEDFEQYKKVRGFVFEDPLEYMPGYHIYSNEELDRFLSDIHNHKDIYKEKRAHKLSVMHNQCNNYSKRIWETIKAM